MTRTEFEVLVRELSAEIPADYFDGIAEVVVSPRTVPHPERDEIFTLGQCIPLPIDGESPDAVQSRIVLFYGSFAALAAGDPEFGWQDEAWETLTHEVRHHIEWRARHDDLEAFDRAAESNYARHDGDPFDSLFYLDGEREPDGGYRVDEDWFIDRVVATRPATVTFNWHERQYDVAVPDDVTLPAYLHVSGVIDPAAGDLVISLRRKGRFGDLFRAAPLSHCAVIARQLED